MVAKKKQPNSNSNSNTNSKNVVVAKNTMVSIKNAVNGTLSRKAVMNNLAHSCIDSKTFAANSKKTSVNTIGSEEAYQNSIGPEIIAFSKKFTDKQKHDINYVLYHRANSDGISASFIFWKYATNSGKDKSRTDIIFEPFDPGFVRGGGVNPRITAILDKLQGKNVLGLDLSLNGETLSAIKNAAASFIWIDDHASTRNAAGIPEVFVGKGHAACAYTYKFFYPDKPIPVFIQYIDNSDAKLFLPFLPYGDLFNLAFGVRITNNVLLSKQMTRQVYGGIFEQMNEMFPEDKQPTFMIFIGNYMNEIRENMKYEIVNLAQPATFQGYRVGVLNFDAPGLAKVVGRQIVSNFKARKVPIDFSVIWAYQYLKREYRIQLATDHSTSSINVAEIATKLGSLPEGGKEGGGGHPNMASFYWKGNIFDLFTKKLI